MNSAVADWQPQVVRVSGADAGSIGEVVEIDAVEFLGSQLRKSLTSEMPNRQLG